MLNLNFNPFPIIHTGRLTLRAFNKNDANDLFKLQSDKNVMQFIDRPMAATVKDASDHINKIRGFLKTNYGITWAITIDNNKKLIGTIGLWRIIHEHYRAEIGYMLHTNFHSKGIMHEAMKPVLDYGFNIMNLHSVEANVNPDNHASIKLLEKNGFVKEAYFKENYYYNGKFLDSMIYSLLVQDYKH